VATVSRLERSRADYGSFMVQKHEIVLALAGDDGTARGGVWRIAAKKSDFYLDLIGM